MVNRIPQRQVHVGEFEDINDDDLTSTNYAGRAIETDAGTSDDQTFISSNPYENGVEGDYIERNTYVHKGRPIGLDYNDLVEDFSDVESNPHVVSNQMVQPIHFNTDQLYRIEARPSVADIRVDFNLKQASITTLMRSGKKVVSTVPLHQLNDWLEKTKQQSTAD